MNTLEVLYTTQIKTTYRLFRKSNIIQPNQLVPEVNAINI